MMGTKRTKDDVQLSGLYDQIDNGVTTQDTMYTRAGLTKRHTIHLRPQEYEYLI